MQKKKIVAAIIIALCGIGAAAWAVEYWLPVHNGEQIVREALVDPESARFEQVRYNPATEATCGLVNSKNRMGGYVGAAQFVVTADKKVHFQPTTDIDAISDLQEKIKALQEKLQHSQLALANCKFDDK